MRTGLDLPHHDGSALYVDRPDPTLGETVSVLVRVPHGYTVQGVHVRTVHDGEPRFRTALVDRVDTAQTWWRAEVTVFNPVTNYRFLLDRGRDGYSWLNGSGVHDRDVPDRHDFRFSAYPPPPAWARDTIAYQIFPDRFASSGQSRRLPGWAVESDWYGDPVARGGELAMRQLYSGDLAGIEARLDHLASLHVNLVYLTPFFTAGSNHRYDAASFTEVDPVLGGDRALASLSAALHRRGMRLMGDLTTNHTGDRHPWFQASLSDPQAPEADFYYWQPHPEYACWRGVRSLPKLNHGSPELRRRLIEGPDSTVAHWLNEPYGLDGWRIDVANMTGRYGAEDITHEVARTLRTTMAQTAPDTLLIAEHSHDFTADLPGDGWHGTMNYAGFLRPLWRWLVSPHTPVKDFLGVPVPIAPANGRLFAETLSDFTAAVSWRALSASFNLVGSHDTPRIRTVTEDPRLVDVAAGLLFTLPGIPMVFAGDEIGLVGADHEDARRPFPWDRQDTWDNRILSAYRTLGALRQRSTALRHGGLRWAHLGADTLMFLRETDRERVLVVANRAATKPIRLSAAALGITEGVTSWYGDHPLQAQGGEVTLPDDGPGVWIWCLAD